MLITGAAGGLVAPRQWALPPKERVWSLRYGPCSAGKLVSTLGTQTTILAGDIADEAVSETLVSLAVSTFGRLDIAVNNAGIEHRALTASGVG